MYIVAMAWTRRCMVQSELVERRRWLCCWNMELMEHAGTLKERHPWTWLQIKTSYIYYRQLVTKNTTVEKMFGFAVNVLSL